jgi:hypothetical protein
MEFRNRRAARGGPRGKASGYETRLLAGRSGDAGRRLAQGRTVFGLGRALLGPTAYGCGLSPPRGHGPATAASFRFISAGRNSFIFPEETAERWGSRGTHEGAPTPVLIGVLCVLNFESGILNRARSSRAWGDPRGAGGMWRGLPARCGTGVPPVFPAWARCPCHVRRGGLRPPTS